MNKEQYEEIVDDLQAVERKIEELPDSSGNGQLIDALSHARCMEEHLRRYFQLRGVTE